MMMMREMMRIRRMSSLSPVSIVRRAEERFGGNVAIWKNEDMQYTYDDLIETSKRSGSELLRRTESKDLKEKCVGFLCPPSFDYVAMQWGIWRAGGIAVPLCSDHSVDEVKYVLEDSDCDIVMSHKDFTKRIESASKGLDCDLFEVSEDLKEDAESVQLPSSFGDDDRGALMIYTSGTTGKPKGVVSTHSSLEAQIISLVDAWGWSENDRILNVLPLHHVHGVVNVVSCALWSGACVEMPGSFNAEHVWSRFRSDKLSLFMAVPTVYSRPIAYWERNMESEEEQKCSTEAASRLRLMVSGSAALPNSVFERWQKVGGHTLLERYGMTEIGMALSNPLKPIEARRPGCVGLPLPGVEVRIVEGELRVRGPAVFREYWRKPEATKSEFDEDGWFKTGAIAAFSESDNAYRILGRASVDIIKSGGYKLSALDIERVLLENEKISEVAIVGLEDPEWGQRVAAQIVQSPDCSNNDEITLKELRDWCSTRMAKYKIPSVLRVVPAIEKNAMGKINKKELVKNWQ